MVLNMFFDYFLHIGSVNGLYVGPKFGNVKKIDLCFPELKFAHLERFLVGMFENLKSTKLEFLCVSNRNGSKETLDLDRLPVSLKCLWVCYLLATVYEQSLKSPSVPRLERINFYDVSVEENAVSRVSKFIAEQLKANTKAFEWQPYFHLETLDATELVSHALMDVASTPLTHCCITRRLPARSLHWLPFQHLKRLDIIDLVYDTLLIWLFPMGLEELIISGGLFAEFTPFEDALPPELKHIEINNLKWRANLPALKLLRLEKLQYLKLLCMTPGENIEQFVFPDSVKELHFTENPVGSFDGAVFPKSLLSLNISSSELTSVDNVLFPQCLVSLDIACNRLNSVDTVNFPRNLEELDLDRNELKSVCKIKLPSTIKVISLNGNKLEKVDLSTNFEGQALNLDKLELQGNISLIVDNLKLPPTLKCLSLDGCNLKSLDGIQFPVTIEELDLSENSLTFFDATIMKDCNLKKLNLSLNEFQFMDVNLPPSIKVLSLGDNKLEMVPTCINGLVNLIHLDLSENLIRMANGKLKSKKLEYMSLEGNNIEALWLEFEQVCDYGLPAINLQRNAHLVRDIYMQRVGERVILYTKGMIGQSVVNNPVIITLEQLVGNSAIKRELFCLK